MPAKWKAPFSPPCTSPNLPLCVCEKNISSWLSLMILDNKQGNGLDYLKMKKKSVKTFNWWFLMCSKMRGTKKKGLSASHSSRNWRYQVPNKGPWSSKMRSQLTTWVDFIQENSLKVSLLVTESGDWWLVTVPWDWSKHRLKKKTKKTWEKPLHMAQGW